MRLNKYQIFHKEHYKKIGQELKAAGIKINRKKIDAIVEATSFENRSKNYPDACEFYSKQESCHPDIDIKDLCCLFCACPYFKDYYEDGCEINSNKTKLDCPDCSFPHTKGFSKGFLSIPENFKFFKNRL
jgi:hypothetical protein